MKTPSVSIVIPAYNHGHYVAEAVQSALAQDYPDVEVIVLDDGSTDDTAKVLAGLSGNFLWQRQKNMGQALTLAKGWASSRGDILGYLSADDVLGPTAVSAAIVALEASPSAVAAYPDYLLIDLCSRPVRRVHAPAFDYRHMLRDVVCLPGPGAFFRRSAYQAAGAWNPSLRQMPDYDFWLRLGLLGPFVRIPEPLASFRVHKGSHTYSAASPACAAEPVSIIKNILKNPSLPPNLLADGPTALANAHLTSAQLHLRAGRLRDGLSATRNALILNARAVFSVATLRLLANALFNRLGHQILWRIRSIQNSR